jgi:hypothetical protein
MLLDSIVKLHDKIQNMKLGANREAEIEELEQAQLRRLPLAVSAGPVPGPILAQPAPAQLSQPGQQSQPGQAPAEQARPVHANLEAGSRE